MVAWPVTSPCAWIVRQSPKRGGTLMSAIFSMNDAGLSDRKRPERSRSERTTDAISRPSGLAMKSGIAIGIGSVTPTSTRTCSAARAGACSNPKNATAATRRSLLNDRFVMRNSFLATIVFVPCLLGAYHSAGIERHHNFAPRVVAIGGQPLVGFADIH